MEPQQSGIRTWQWVVTVIVIIALIVIGIFVFGAKKTPTPTDTTTTPVTTNTQTPSTTAIIMSDQFPGDVVYLSTVQASQPIWVAIHKDNKGQPGEVIGSMRFAAGVNPGRITLKSPTIDGGTYYAVVYSDDGDAIFNPAKDLPLKDASGKAIMRVFRATSSANIEVKG